MSGKQIYEYSQPKQDISHYQAKKHIKMHITLQEQHT